MTPSATTGLRWRQVEFEDSKFDVATKHGAIQTIVRKHFLGGDVLPLQQRRETSEVGVWDAHRWLPLRWFWRALWASE